MRMMDVCRAFSILISVICKCLRMWRDAVAGNKLSHLRGDGELITLPHNDSMN